MTPNDPLVVGMTAAVGFEWLVIDTEHGPIDFASMATRFGMITRSPLAPFVRGHALSEENVKRALNAGAWGMLAPTSATS
jgi:2-keto-3-deoxy-L-rhamnonate aldolase RhmA